MTPTFCSSEYWQVIFLNSKNFGAPKRSPTIDFCKCLKSFDKWENSLQFLKISKFENIGGLRFGLRSKYFSKIWVDRFWILSGIKNQIDSIKTHVFIQLWSALTQIFKKVIGHFQFWSPKWGPGAPKIYFSRHAYSRGAKKFSRRDTSIIFCSSESWHAAL